MAESLLLPLQAIFQYTSSLILVDMSSAGISPTMQPSNTPYNTVWPGRDRPGQPTLAPVEGATIRQTHPTRIPTPEPLTIFILNHPTCIPSPTHAEVSMRPGGGVRTPPPQIAPTDASIRPGGGRITRMPNNYQHGGAGVTHAPVEEVRTTTPIIGKRSNHKAKLAGASDAPVEEVRTTTPIIGKRSNHKSKHSGATDKHEKKAHSVKTHKKDASEKPGI